MGRLAFEVVCLVWIAVAIGCRISDGGAGSGGSGGSPGTGGASGMDGAAGNGGAAGMTEGVVLTATVTQAPSLDDKLFDGPPLEGAELCEADTDNCATSDAAGAMQIMVRANQEITYTLSKDGFVTYLIGDVSEPPTLGATWPMISDALMATESERVGFDWPSEDGLVALAVFDLQPGVTWETVGEESTLYYMDEDGIAQTDLSETTSFGRGGAYDVSPGVQVVEFGGAAMNCETAIAWPESGENRIRVPVRAEHISYGSMNCDDP